ncbi:MAG: hypothetical protein IPL65_03810 [Lewinellaceae bacterium]|nr:hypothetical protein [Lewinellaceae bacterium]
MRFDTNESMKNSSSIYAVLTLVIPILFSACYSFKGIAIDPSVHTYAVRNFESLALNAPPNLSVDFTERLKDKIRTETRLTLNNDTPDIEFTGKVVDYRVIPVAPKPGEIISLNRLEIVMSVGLTNNLSEKDSWTSDRRFSFFAEFPNDVDLLTIQDSKINEINNQLLEDIFNAAFNNW